MTSTLWFWILCIIVVLTIIGILRRFIGRVIILCIVLALLFFVYKLIAPNSAANILNWLKDVPAKTTNYINRELLDKDIIIPLNSDIKDNVYDSVSGIVDNVEGSLDDAADSITDSVENIVDETKFTVDEVVDVEVEEEQEDESRYSWFARLFKKNKKVDNKEKFSDTAGIIEVDELEDISGAVIGEKQEDTVEIKLSSGSVVIETTTASGEKIIEEVVSLKGKEENSTTGAVKESVVKTGVVQTGAVKENVIKTGDNANAKSKSGAKVGEDVVILPSNPKNPKNNDKTDVKASGSVITTTRGGLTAEEIRETNSIFN